MMVYFSVKDAYSTFVLQVTLPQGGGTHVIDVDKDSDLTDLTALVTDHYFAAGQAPIMDLSLTSLSWYLANFQGVRLKDSDFPVENLVRINTSPLRIYLHTKPVSFHILSCFGRISYDPNLEAYATINQNIQQYFFQVFE